MKKSQIMMVKKRGKTEKSNTTLNGQPRCQSVTNTAILETILMVETHRRQTLKSCRQRQTWTIIAAIDLPDKEIQIALKLIETILIPKIYQNVETWTGISYSHIRELDEMTIGTIEKNSLKPQIQLPPSESMRKLAFCQQRKRYQKKKLRYLHRLLSRNGKKLAKQVYKVQKDLELPKG